jgi:hypothetical protein
MSKSAMRVRLLQAGRENMTGVLGRHEFKDGVSVQEIPLREVNRLAAILSIGDEEGNPLAHGFYLIPDASKTEAPIVNFDVGTNDPSAKVGGDDCTRVPTTPEQPVVDRNALQVVVVTPPPSNGEDETVDADVAAPTEILMKIYTQSELEEIADKRGIEGLRAIGTPLGVKSNSIAKLIEGIREAQAKLPVKAE